MYLDHACAEKQYILSNLPAMMQKAQDHGAGVELSITSSLSSAIMLALTCNCATAELAEITDLPEIERRLCEAQVPDDVWAFYSRVLTVMRLCIKMKELKKEIKLQQRSARKLKGGSAMPFLQLR
jgi:hypothetical protein